MYIYIILILLFYQHLTHSIIASCIIAFLLGFLVVSYVNLKFTYKKIILDVQYSPIVYHFKDTITFHYHVKSKYLFSSVVFTLIHRNLHRENDINKYNETIDSSDPYITNKYMLSLPSSVSFEIKQIIVYDITRVFKKKVNFNKVIEFNVYPYPSENKIQKLTKEVYGEQYYIDQKGDDYSEMYDYHEYQENEELRHVHHGLSAKYDTYMIKEGTKENKKIDVYKLIKYQKFDDMVEQLSGLYAVFDKSYEEQGYCVFLYNEEEVELYDYEDLYGFYDKVYKEYL